MPGVIRIMIVAPTIPTIIYAGQTIVFLTTSIPDIFTDAEPRNKIIT